MSNYTKPRSRSIALVIKDMNTAQTKFNEMNRHQELRGIRNEEATPTIGPGRIARLSLPIRK